MKSKCGLGVLLLAALLSSIGVWFLPVNTAAADILLLLARGSATHIAAATESYGSRTYGNHPTEATGLESGLTEETTSLIVSDVVTNLEETSYNLTLTITTAYSVVTPSRDIFSTQSPDTSWITVGLTAAVDSTTDISTGTGRVTGAEVISHTNSSPSLPYTEKPSSEAPDITTAAMETDRTVCIYTTGPTNAEVLAIVVGAVFITILLSALLYQFAVFLKKKKNNRDSSVYIIENELHKYDLEANGLQPETKL